MDTVLTPGRRDARHQDLNEDASLETRSNPPTTELKLKRQNLASWQNMAAKYTEVGNTESEENGNEFDRGTGGDSRVTVETESGLRTDMD